MITIKTILLPTDGSECSGNATAYALSFARQYGARVVALHVIDRRWEEHMRYALVEAGQDIAQKIRQGDAEEARGSWGRSPTPLTRPAWPLRPGS